MASNKAMLWSPIVPSSILPSAAPPSRAILELPKKGDVFCLFFCTYGKPVWQNRFFPNSIPPLFHGIHNFSVDPFIVESYSARSICFLACSSAPSTNSDTHPTKPWRERNSCIIFNPTVCNWCNSTLIV